MGNAGRRTYERTRFDGAAKSGDAAKTLEAFALLCRCGQAHLADAATTTSVLSAVDHEDWSRYGARLLARLILGSEEASLTFVDEVRILLDRLPDPDALDELRRFCRRANWTGRPRSPLHGPG